MAYAPECDLPKWFGPRLRVLSFFLPGVADFVTQSSPSTHISRLKCPTLLFHAEDDTTCDIADTQKFADQLKAQGTDVTLVTVPTGEHYQSMIDEGIPAGIRWLRERTGK
jgi:dipeptidyl aminopeptidase/acylaminoacyl peptidase